MFTFVFCIYLFSARWFIPFYGICIYTIFTIIIDSEAVARIQTLSHCCAYSAHSSSAALSPCATSAAWKRRAKSPGERSSALTPASTSTKPESSARQASSKVGSGSQSLTRLTWLARARGPSLAELLYSPPLGLERQLVSPLVATDGASMTTSGGRLSPCGLQRATRGAAHCRLVCS